MKNTTHAPLWRLSDTAIRNPYRITGALKIFRLFFDGGPNFSGGNSTQQLNFLEKLISHTEDGKKITNFNPIEEPVAEYDQTAINTIAKKQEKARYWITLMEHYGLINAYEETTKFTSDIKKASITEMGELFLEYPELRNEIWLRQVLKRQFPNHKATPTGIKIRGGWWLLNLILELDGLERWEMSLASTSKDENFSFMKKLIEEYRIKRHSKQYENKLTQLKEEFELEAIRQYFASDYKSKQTELKKIIYQVKTKKLNSSQDIDAGLIPIITTHNGPNVPLAKSTRAKIISLLLKKEFSEKKHLEILDNWYLGMKRRTVFVDYKDLHGRILERTGFVKKIRKSTDVNESEDYFRLRILDIYLDLVKEAVKNTPKLKEITNEKEKEAYYRYLIDYNQPQLLIDNKRKIEVENLRLITQLTNSGKSGQWLKNKINPSNSKFNISTERIVFNRLFDEVEKQKEEEFFSNLDPKLIESKILNLQCSNKKINLKNVIRSKPILMEETIWYAIAKLGGYENHVSETRNFHVDSHFNQIFTAGGDMPDMKFRYKLFDEIIEVTTSQGKTQWRMEKEPVPRHVANHKFYNKKETRCLFIAPEIHDETLTEFCKFSNGKKFPVKTERIGFHIIPLSVAEFHAIWKKCVLDKNPSEIWIKIISDLHAISNNDPKKWRQAIQNYIDYL